MENLNSVESICPTAPTRSHVLVFTSGKGGVGKSCITVNVAAAMVRRGARVCIFDADTGLANINILLGLRPEFTLEHVLSGEKSIHDIVLKTAEGVALVPGASGIAEFANIDVAKIQRLCAALTELEAEYDYFLIDTAAGVADSVLQFVESAPSTFLVITPEPTSLTDAFSLLKLLNGRSYHGRLRVVVNQVADYSAATETYRRFVSAVDKYLGLKVDYGGFVARDDNVPKSVALQIPLVELVSNSPAGRCLYALADNLLKYTGAKNAEAGLADYWQNLVIENQPEPTKPVDELPEPRLIENEIPLTLPATEYAAMLLTALKSQHTEMEQMDGFISDFVSAYVGKFGVFPQNFRQLFFRWLEAENYPASRIMELMATLETLYTVRHEQPLFSIEDSTARLIAQCQGSESRFYELINQLRLAYRQKFQKDVFDAYQDILDSIQGEDYTEEHFEQMLVLFRETFQTRFKRPYKERTELLLESTSDALRNILANEDKVQEQLLKLMDKFQQLSSMRDTLISAVDNANNKPPLKLNTL